MTIDRRTFLGVAAAGLYAGAATQAFSQDKWPTRTVRLISPYGAGGPNDIATRLIGKYLEERLGQSFIVENKAGAGTMLANDYVAHVTPDGNTLLHAAAPYSTLEALQGKLNYDPRKDLQPIAMTATVPLFLVVNADAPAKTVAEFVAYGKSKADGLNFGSPGNGSLPHLAVELLMRDAGIKGTVIQYRGDVPAYTDLLGGRIDATLTAITAALPHIQAGKLRTLGVAATARSEIFKDAPPLAEQGLPRVVAAGWYGFMAPAGVPASIINRLDTEINRALREPEMKKKFLEQGMETHGLSAADFGKFIEAETAKWAAVIKAAGIKAS